MEDCQTFFIEFNYRRKLHFAWVTPLENEYKVDLVSPPKSIYLTLDDNAIWVEANVSASELTYLIGEQIENVME